MKIKSYIFYSIVFLVVIAAKVAYTQASNDTLAFILKPLSVVISFILNSDFVYTNASGFYFETLNITIDKSCSGTNFWIISFAMFSVSVLKVLKSNLKKALSLVLVLAGTFLFTLFANTSRILTSIFISNQTNVNYTWLHQAEGVFIYISLLILAYTIFNHIISKFNNHHAKLT